MNAAEGVRLYRAIGESELDDLLRFGDYGLSISASGKYFAFTERGVRDFANHPFNRGRRLTITVVVVASTFLDRGFILGADRWSGR